MENDSVNRFWREYERHYAAYVRARPQHYGHSPEQATLVAHKVRERISEGGIQSINIESKCFRLTCEALGIEHSHAGIESYWRESTRPGAVSARAAPSFRPAACEEDESTVRRRWAQDWFAGAAYCPRCQNGLDISRSSSSGNESAIIEKWSCPCGQTWKVELRECAATADADASPGEWIERYEPLRAADVVGLDAHPQLSAALSSAITRACDASFACGEWSRDSEEPWSEVYRESVLARKALEVLCAGLFAGADVGTPAAPHASLVCESATANVS